IYTALLTPFDSNGNFNKKALEKLIEFNLEKGVSGFYVTGSTGEAFLLSESERTEVMEAVADIAGGSGASLIAHVGSISTKYSCSLALHAQKLGYDAVSAVPPFYFNFSGAEIKKYYADIAHSVDIPMIIYNIPAFSGVTMTITDIDQMLTDDKIAGVKNTSSDYFVMEKIKAHNPHKMLFNGYDETFLAGLAMGADGAIGSTYNFMADKFVNIMKLFEQNKIQEAQQIQHTANRIIEALVSVGVMQGEKAILSSLGIAMGNCRPPFGELTEQQKKKLLDTILPLL
ncbi:MAG: N-acetylneuraminate lyase, partial [Clostridia bacterium]|nr:N-acetylneuraminate lyase [Clostridia bacterium]